MHLKVPKDTMFLPSILVLEVETGSVVLLVVALVVYLVDLVVVVVVVVALVVVVVVAGFSVVVRDART